MPIKLNVALELPPSIARQVVSVSKDLAKNGGAEFVLDGTHIIPHITLLMGFYPEEELDRIKEHVAAIAASAKPVLCAPMPPYARRGYLGINIRTSRELLAVHLAAVDKLEGMQVESAGYGDQFMPHITLLKTKSPRTKPPLVKLPAFTCTQVTLFEAGKHGTAIRRIQSWPLQG